MTNKEALKELLTGKKQDKILWIPRLNIWYNAHKTQGTLPGEFEELSLREIEKELGMGTIARDGKIFRKEYKNMEVIERKTGDILERDFLTPIGQVQEKFKINQKAKDAGLPYVQGRIEHCIKSVDDYRIMEYTIENEVYIPTYADYLEYEREIGEEGIPVVDCGHDPLFMILHEFIGYNQGYYEMHDHAKEFNQLYERYCEKRKEHIEVIKNSPATLIVYGYHYDSQMTHPQIFDKYIKPHLSYVANKLHEANKFHAVHADADSILLLKSFYETGIDMAECFCTAPMVKCTLEDAINAWGDDIIIWGGIPSTVLCPQSYPQDYFTKYLEKTFDLISRSEARIILGVSDNVMPQTDINRLKIIPEYLKEFGLQ